MTLDLPAALAKDAAELAGAIAARHGGRDALSVVDMEVVACMVRCFNAMRAAAPGDLPQLVGALSRLESMLPVAGKAAATPLDRLRDYCATSHAPEKAAGASDRSDLGHPSGDGLSPIHGLPTQSSAILPQNGGAP